MEELAKYKQIGRKKDTPVLRFQEFIGPWTERRFGDVFEFIKTNSFSRDHLNYEKGVVKNIHYGDIHVRFKSNFNILNEKVPFLNDAIDISRIEENTYCKEGDLVLADASEDYQDVGKAIEIINLNGEKVVGGLHTFVARPNNIRFASGFAGYLMQTWTIRHQVMMLAQGSKVHGISTNHLSLVIFKTPSPPEQQKIAAFLTTTDQRISLLQKKKALLEQYKKGVTQKIFQREIWFKDEDGKEFPEWEIKRFGEVFERITRKNKENNLNVLTISAQQGLVNQESYFNKSVSAKDVTGYYLLEKDDFAYNKSYSKGYPMGAIKRLTEFDKGVVSTLYICFKAIEDNVLFLEQYFDSGLINGEIQKIAQEGVRNHGLLNISVVEFFRDIEIRMPCKSEQQKIANFLSSIDRKIKLVNTQLEKTQQWKKGLLQQMFI